MTYRTYDTCSRCAKPAAPGLLCATCQSKSWDEEQELRASEAASHDFDCDWHQTAQCSCVMDSFSARIIEA